jgi:adenine phosphoribosyltransferase
MEMNQQEAQQFIVEIADYPKPGVIFKDLTPLFANPDAMNFVIKSVRTEFAGKGITKIAGIEARGFMFGSALAQAMGLGFVPIRKKGKLPRETYRAEYELEYGTDAVEIHTDALSDNDAVLLIDDVLATGGTASAAATLVQLCGASLVGLAVLLNLDFLGGDQRFGEAFPDTEIFTVFA